LLDGTKAYLHAVIDNYSRRILAWTVAETLNPMNTCFVLDLRFDAVIAGAAFALTHQTG
jgi:transposase InsO family protein